MRCTLLALLSAALLLPGTTTLAADPCDRLPKPSLTLTRHEEPISLDLQTSYRTLTLIGPAVVRPGMKVLGLTRGKAIVSFQTRILSYVDPGGRWECASPQLTVSYGYSPLTVYVAREFARGSCAWNEIHAHEMRHVNAYLKHLEVIEPTLREALANRFVTGGLWRGPVGEARNRLQQELEERWAPYVRRLLNAVDPVQARIDTPEEYARVAASCNREVQRLTR